jgi:hypothetical protein
MGREARLWLLVPSGLSYDVQTLCLPIRHSCRNATIGSILLARHAGK